MTHRRLVLLAIALALGVALFVHRPEPTRALGDVCARTADCRTGICAYGRCRMPCRGHDECATKVCFRLRVYPRALSRFAPGGCRLEDEVRCGRFRPLGSGLYCAGMPLGTLPSCEQSGCPYPDDCWDEACFPPGRATEAGYPATWRYYDPIERFITEW